MTVKEIDEQISKLRQQRHALLRTEVEEFQKEAQKNIGRCFLIDDSIYVKVLDIPRIVETKTGPEINKYQYPALELRGKVIPFTYTTLFSGAWGVGNNILGTKYTEVTAEEFEAEFNRRIEKFKERVL
jgi:hypothetical protein